ncbi:MAG: phytanoyl-CoA dioxygenase [Geminicoccaceae bacterium]
MSDQNRHPATILSDGQVQQFIQDGFVRLDHAFPKTLADECRDCLWRETGCDRDDPSTWTRPVIRIHGHDGEPFRKAINTPELHTAFDRLIGKGRWRPRSGIGSFPIRFPHPDDPGDAGWHIDKGFPGEDAIPGDYNSHRVNIVSKGRALLMLFLFSDVGRDDAPTRIRIGSHRPMARRLVIGGDAGLSAKEIDREAKSLIILPETLATGEAGTVYLCHPFLVHAAQRHRGTSPRFLAQPPLHSKEPLQLHRKDNDYSPVEMAIRLALEEQGES